MSSERHARARSCVGKVGYDGRRTAGQAIWRSVLRDTTLTGKLHIYRCEFCHKYHIGHRRWKR